MGFFEMALLVSLIMAGLFFILDLFRLENNGNGLDLKGSFITGFLLFLWLVGFNYLVFYFSRPSLTGPYGGWLWLCWDIVFAVAAFGILSSVRQRISLSVVAGSIILVVWLLHASFLGIFTPWNTEEASKLAGFANIVEMPTGDYPETDADHILLVSEEAALFKAKQIISNGADESGRNLSTIYRVGYPALQSINNHLYWVYQLTFAGYRVANQAGRIVPGYIVVDAEDPDANAQMRLGYKMKYTLEAPTGNNIERYVYNSGYRHWVIDDLTIEIRDDWKPFYSASLNRPKIKFTGEVPEKMILVDPETGAIEEYPLDKVPEWVDRVYSRHVVESFLNWHGRWGEAPWKFMGGIFETAAGRTKIAGRANLVYTKSGHPAWQMFMTSLNNDTSVTDIVLFEGRSNTVKIYHVPGIATEEAVLHSFETTQKNFKNFLPMHPSIHKIYGELTWVVSYVSDKNVDGSAPFQGLGLLSSNDVQGASVIFTKTKTDALREYRQWLVQGNSNQAPEENQMTKVIEGTVTRVATVVIDGNTNYLLTLDSDPSHIFQGKIGENLELPFVKEGHKVQITYLDVGKARVDIMSYDDLGF